MNLNELQSNFYNIYGKTGKTSCFHSPGRVNLIGEHTDYNGGFVFPCALSFGTYAVVQLRNDQKVRFSSTNFSFTAEVDLNDIKYNSAHNWVNYPKGVIAEFQKLGLGSKLTGMDILFSGNIPNGAGLSSSASIELAMSVILNDLFECGLSMLDMVKLSQRAENLFIGVSCGIMDQFAVGMGKADHAICLHCKDNSFQYVPIKLQGSKIVIANTNKKRRLSDSKYNERRGQCELAVEQLKTQLNIDCLGDVTPLMLQDNKALIQDLIVLKRAEHVVNENERVKKAVECINQGNIKEFGRLMVLSHNSLRDLYEVTGVELDTLVEEALKIKGTIGSRMTGAGFGGCTVSIVEDGAVEEFIQTVGYGYHQRTGLKADFFIAEIGDGASAIKN